MLYGVVSLCFLVLSAIRLNLHFQVVHRSLAWPICTPGLVVLDLFESFYILTVLSGICASIYFDFLILVSHQFLTALS